MTRSLRRPALILLILSALCAGATVLVVARINHVQDQLDLLYMREATFASNRLRLEMLRFETTVQDALLADMDGVTPGEDHRLWYDLVWNRLHLLARDSIYLTLPNGHEQQDLLAAMRDRHIAMEEILTGSADTLLANRPTIARYFAEQADDVATAVRNGSENRRILVDLNANHIQALHRVVAALLISMTVAFAVFAVLMFRQIHSSERNRRRLEELSLRLETALEHARSSNEAKDTFLAHMSHEFRTPLNAILGYSQLIHHQGADTLEGRFRGYVANIEIAGRQLLGFVEDLFDLSRINSSGFQLHPETLTLADNLEEARTLAIAALSSGKRHEIDVQVDSRARRITADRRAVTQILVNLLTNALKHSPEGQPVLVRAEQAETDTLRISVIDHGTGMTAEEAKQAFEPFWQAKKDRTASRVGGLGLYICRQLIELQGGHYAVETAPGKGTRVDVYLPRGEVGTGRAQTDEDSVAETDAVSLQPARQTANRVGA